MSGEELRAALDGVIDRWAGAGLLYIPSHDDGNRPKAFRDELFRAARTAPSTPEPSGTLRCECGDEIQLVHAHYMSPAHAPRLRAAPSTEPALDVERLALAEHRRAAHRDGSGCTHQWFRASDRSGAIGSVNIEDAAWLAAEYDRLAEPQP